MEFRRGNPERRQDRRICPKCARRTGAATCKACRKATKPRIQITWFIHGQRHRELTGCWDEREAQAVLQRKEEDYWRQQGLTRAETVGGSLAEARDAFTAELAHCSDNYVKQVTTALDALIAGVGAGVAIQTIGRDDLEQLRDDGLQVLAPSTVRSYMLVLRRFFGWCRKRGRVRTDPMEDVRLPRARPRRGHLRPDEVGPVLSAMWELAPAVAPIAAVIVLGGWRKGEILNLRRRDCDLDGRWAYVLDYEGDDLTDAWSPKTESSTRAVPLHPVVAHVLGGVEPVARPDGEASPWMFPVTDRRKRHRYTDARGRRQPVYGDRRSPGTSFLGKKLKQALTHAGITRPLTVHDLRRTFAVLLQEAGAPDSIIAAALGHAGRGVTELHYLPRRKPLIQTWVDRIEVPGLALSAGAATYVPPLVVADEPPAQPSARIRFVPPNENAPL